MRQIDLILMALVALCSFIPGYAGSDESEAAWAQDKGPAQVEISGYPADAQEGYKILVNHCGDCHSVARPLNTTMPPEYWAMYVGNMEQRHGVKLVLADQRKLVAFLLYDQKNRKDKNPKAFFPPHAPNDSHGKEAAPKSKDTP